MDSFYEYLLKSFILFNEQEDLDTFQRSYENIKSYLRKGWEPNSIFPRQTFSLNLFHPSRPKCNDGDGEHPIYVNVDMKSGMTSTPWIDALQVMQTNLPLSTQSSNLRKGKKTYRRHLLDCKFCTEILKKQFAATPCITLYGKNGMRYQNVSTGNERSQMFLFIRWGRSSPNRLIYYIRYTLGYSKNPSIINLGYKNI